MITQKKILQVKELDLRDPNNVPLYQLPINHFPR